MKSTKVIPELVSPAGDWPSLRTAVDNGADSVYFGLNNFNMRQMAPNFDALEIPKVMDFLRSQKKKGYLALNVIVKDDELNKIARVLKTAKRSGVDAVILWDMAVLSLARQEGLAVHLSTQASVANSRALAHYAALGVTHVVLARECTLQEIQKIAAFIKKEKVNCTIETFVHGAMCLSISGRCFLSYDSFGQSANRGACLQPCRREYLIREIDGDTEYIIGQDYVLSPKDLCAIDFIDELVGAGIRAFKIEGRMRPPEYIAATTRVYREALDACMSGTMSEAKKKQWKARLSQVYNRGFSEGFYFGSPQNAVSRRREHTQEKIFLGEVRKFYKKISVAEIMIQKGPLKYGDTLLFIGKSFPLRQIDVKEIERNHEPVREARKGEMVGIKVPFAVKAKEKVFLCCQKTAGAERE